MLPTLTSPECSASTFHSKQASTRAPLAEYMLNEHHSPPNYAISQLQDPWGTREISPPSRFFRDSAVCIMSGPNPILVSNADKNSCLEIVVISLETVITSLVLSW